MISNLGKLQKKIKGKLTQWSEAQNRFIDERVDITAQILARVQLAQTPPRGISSNFNALFVTSEADLKFLRLNIQNLKNLYSELNKIIVVTPNTSNEYCKQLRLDFDVVLISDQDLFNDKIEKIAKKFPQNRRNWIRQQYIKTQIVFNSELPVLIVDADTFVLQKFLWFSSENSQLLLVNSSDFHFEYNAHFERFFSGPAPLLNFVAHVQMQFPSILKHIYGGNLTIGWIKWLKLGRTKFQGSPVSEYQSYGLYLLKNENHVYSFYTPRHLHIPAHDFLESPRKLLELSEKWDLVTIVDK